MEEERSCCLDAFGLLRFELILVGFSLGFCGLDQLVESAWIFGVGFIHGLAFCI
jgi:hypothetical protein